MTIFENRIYRSLCYPLSLIYGVIIWIRNKCYDKNIFRSFKLKESRVISVGNISVGGTGKTPVIKFLADYLKAEGFKVAILSRGYKRKSKGSVVVSDGTRILNDIHQTGDEPFLLAMNLPDVPIVVESDRYKGALLIVARFQPDVILLDDGFQHRRLSRDVDIVTVDASTGFGSGLLLPVGFLREPLSSLRRANLIWLTRVNQGIDPNALISRIKKITQAPVLLSNHRPAELIHANTHDHLPLSFLRQKKVLLFSGIANHTAFENTVKVLGSNIIFHKKFPDHHHYHAHDIQTIAALAEKNNIQLILTTEKDFVRLKDLITDNFQIYYLTIEIQLCDHEDDLKNILASIVRY
ncbi:tetraacyldisaccharide 4'-kinase [candidate division KSB1 bacterium]|nr:tetraacyldisaccharide 4'-kinase [candidate division KSB1 bacterium]